MACGADFSDPGAGPRQRASLKELFDSLAAAVEGRYRLTDMLGRGGMGAVFLAEDLRLGRRVALKVLRPELAEDQAFVRRFDREARNAAALDHPNIIPLYSVEQVGEFHYFTMKYVAGESLHELLARGPVPPDQARSILAQAAAGLGHAHQHGVIHRDIKPQNLMIDQSGRVIITDFGISKALQADTQYTSTGEMVGTPSYLSPEQAQSLPVDGRSDQYSLACVGYRMVVGQLPHSAESVHGMMYKHIYEMPTPARQANPQVPAELSEALQRALAKKPAQRFASMEEFAAAVSGQPTLSDAPAAVEPGPPVPRPAPRRRALVLAASLAALLIAASGVALWRAARRSPADLPAESAKGQTSPSVVAPSPDTATITTPAVPPASPDTSPAAAVPSVPPPPAPAVAETSGGKRATERPRSRPVPAPPSNGPRTQRPGAETNVPVPAKVGYVTVNAVPYGTVSIDGVEVGDTPVVGHELPPGQHTVRITREGFRPEVATVTITAGNEVRLSRTLVRAP
jgi:serine/threonine-protein kinase